jgi:hypothetical protein
LIPDARQNLSTMGILRATLWTLGAMVAVGAIVDRASRMQHSRLVQTTLDLKPVHGVPTWQ